MSLGGSKRTISSIAAVAILASSIPSLVSASVPYELVGMGLCQPAPGEEYSRMARAEIATEADCDEECFEITDAVDDRYYRGFSHGETSGHCFCFYDCHRIPGFDPAHEGIWTRHDPTSCQGGEVTASDGALGYTCYKDLPDGWVPAEGTSLRG
eukprot:CAMPEP_0172528376 /NCGR_PEP_ID=MMETSP1067-20121228/2794_1 /TAXON_ID=265564 ORGANISM="Thalassiosira punctigera, Strain Tpunct2005C2" /NCGR_SAMPLE_ID=MMETSP1067 /ASSEMBLY_ACC=CAM_ASM_000444 /LENGTH=153 /DNA_ID=CAMNT_0013312273 /DNA_START=106 /DNA_END=567 /DNA_ORIENTATION=+